ncbi:Folylpolyglutamate synthetase [Malassezia pachydermatis]|uniref:Folylpolyglutamate synthase n=1 Tax=Malassezia pachydermatis TaxID=77020 RepID=A0A0M8MM32_9BASI|nr:bifunctional protein [Malassezia pachydermatis]KOS15236.1 bifunctional protein [Malassezia pachydermatis]
MSTTTASSARSYAAAIDALNSLQSNAATLEAIRRSGRTVNELNEPEMTEYLERIGHQRADLDRIHVIHITGTKGKGSTAAFCDTLLRKVRPTHHAGKIGLYTSPHMVAARERIRIDGEPISEEQFAKFFWEVWDRLEQNPTRRFETTPLRPMYFRFMTILAFHVFISLQVSATLLEVGIGGLYDSTNIVQHPVVTGVTALGLDHTALLGNTIEDIAMQKAGIFKPGAPALSVEQPASSLHVLQSYANKVGASSYEVVPVKPELASIRLGLPGDHQQTNASLAVELVRAFAHSETGKACFPGAADVLGDCGSPLNDIIKEGLSDAFWPGRCQTVPASITAGATYCLDGAHTMESVRFCVKWFVQTVRTSTQPNILAFNCTNGRSAMILLGAMIDELRIQEVDPVTFFQHVYFCTNNTYADGGSASDLKSLSIDPKDLESMSIQRELLQVWCELQHVAGPSADQPLTVTWAQDCVAHVVPSIEHVMDAVRSLHAKAGVIPNVFVTGSLHLVGGFMAHLQAQGMLDNGLRSTQSMS